MYNYAIVKWGDPPAPQKPTIGHYCASAGATGRIAHRPELKEIAMP
jgi:hypothetical protein